MIVGSHTLVAIFTVLASEGLLEMAHGAVLVFNKEHQIVFLIILAVEIRVCL